MDSQSPKDIELQLVYRQSLHSQSIAPNGVAGRELRIVSRSNFFHFPFKQFAKLHSFSRALKSILKLLAGRREYYFFLNDSQNEIITDGWCNFGFCTHYPVEHDSIVIGEIFTPEAYRGKGLSAEALAGILQRYKDSTLKFIYIDTHIRNFAAQRVFAKTGFGSHVFHFRRKIK